MKNSQFILMGDVVSSSELNAQSVRTGLKGLVEACNSNMGTHIISPFTITLGDEFQGISSSLQSGIETLFYFEEESLRQEVDFKLHYVFHFGKIDTEINKKIAYEMMGPGLTKAREMLSSKKRDRRRFEFELSDEKETEQFRRLFEVLDGIILSWKKEDYALILDMIENENNQEVGDKHDKTRAQIWKRRKTLMINEYNQLKLFILSYVH